MYAWSMTGQMTLALCEALLEDCCGGIVETGTIGQVKDTLQLVQVALSYDLQVRNFIRGTFGGR